MTTPSPTQEQVDSATSSGTTDSSKSSGVSPGAVAGAAVGCLIAGLLLGALAAFFLLRRKHRKHAKLSSLHSDTRHVPVAPESKGFGSPDSGINGNDIQMTQFLLDATPDKEIASELQALSELIQQHVENHYHLRPVQASPQSLAPSLSSLGLRELSGLGTEAIAALCIDPKTRYAGLQHVISLVVFASIDFNSRSRLSMLPTPIASFLQSVAPVESRGGDHDATSLALSKWRSLSTFLLHPSRSQRLPLSPVESEVSPKAQNLASALNTYLQQFVPTDQGSLHQQLDHLQAVILECTRLGYEVLSQPGDWRFTYRVDDASAAGGVQPIVLCPGLDKASSRDGKVHSSPRRVVAPVVAQLSHRR